MDQGEGNPFVHLELPADSGDQEKSLISDSHERCREQLRNPQSLSDSSSDKMYSGTEPMRANISQVTG